MRDIFVYFSEKVVYYGLEVMVMAFGKKLQALLDEKNLTVAEAARMTGISYTTLRSIIVRDSVNVGVDVAVKLSKKLGMSIEDVNGPVPEDDSEATIMVDKEKAGLLADMAFLEPDELDQVKGMIRFFAKRAKGRVDRK